MKYFSQYFFSFIFALVNNALCTDSSYESISSYIQDSEIDPDSLYYNPLSQTIEVPINHKNAPNIETELVSGYAENQRLYCKDTSYEVFSRRLINILISNSNFKIKNGLANGRLDLEATEEELELLRAFGNGKIHIREIDHVIVNVIRPIPISLIDEALHYTDRLMIYTYQHRIFFGTILLIVFVLILAYKVSWTRLRVIFLIIDLMIVISFMLTWWELLQESEIKLSTQQHIYSTMPAECRHNKISFVRSMQLFFGFGKDDCLQYFEAVMTNPLLKVTPLHAFSHMCSKFLFYPVSFFGTAISNYIVSVTSALPTPFNMIANALLILLLGVIVPLIIIGLFTTIIFVWSGASMGMKIGPLFHIYLHGRQSTPPTNSIANDDRQAIEIIQENTEQDTLSSTEEKFASNGNNDTLKIMNTLTQTEVKTCDKPKKQEDSDTNSDDFPEEKEYEKISRRKFQEEINKSDIKVETLEKRNQNYTEKTKVKYKQFLEIGGGDS